MSLEDSRAKLYVDLGLTTSPDRDFYPSEDHVRRLQSSDPVVWSRFTKVVHPGEIELSKFNFLTKLLLKDRRVARWDLLKPKNRVTIILDYYWDLSKGVLEKLSRVSRARLASIMNVVEAFNDNLYLANIDRLRKLRHSPQFWKLQKWIISAEIHKSGSAIEDLKKFSALVKHRSIQSETPLPPSPVILPGFAGDKPVNRDILPDFWVHLCPWLRLVWKRGSTLKSEQARVMHLVGNRGYPPPDRKHRSQALREHARLLTEEVAPADVDHSAQLFEHAYQIGKFIKSVKERRNLSINAAHLSLTNSASLENPVKDGGRSRDVAEKFRTWRETIPETDFVGKTWFGVDYYKQAGIPIWKTICYPEGKPYWLSFTDEENFLRRNDEQVAAGESSILFNPNIGFDPETFQYADPIFGLDKYTGYQLLQWSIEEGIKEGFLLGSPYYDETNPLRLNPERHPRIRAATIGEPGWKSRVVTIGEDWLTIFMQPFAHQMRAELEIHPSAKIGLSRGWQMFEYTKTCAWKKLFPDRDNRFYLSSDLKTATDYCRHDYSRTMLQGFLKGLDQESHYNQIVVDLLTGPREYQSMIGRGEFFGRLTTRGVLMGDPGTKIVLTLHNLIAESIAFCDFLNTGKDRDYLLPAAIYSAELSRPTNWRHFVCSGDDHFAHGPIEYLRRITQIHIKNGMCVSTEKNYLSRKGGFYAEEAFLIHEDMDPEAFYNCRKPLAQINYFLEPHIDALKMRLFSPTSKECDGKDEPNPAIGRAQTLGGMLAWWDGGFSAYRKLASMRWEARLNAYLPNCPYFRYLPIKLGGIGAPALHIPKDMLLSSMLSAPPQLINTWVGAMKGDIDPVLQRALATFATNARSRGIERNDIEEQIRETLQNAVLVDIKDIDQLRPEHLSEDEWNNLRLRDKIRIANPKDLVDLRTAIQVIDRPYTFRDMLYPEQSKKHGIDPYRKATYTKLSWAVRERRFLSSIQGSTLIEPLRYGPEEIATYLDKIADAATSGTDPRLTEKKLIFIPKRVVFNEDLCTLQVPHVVENPIKLMGCP